MGKGVRAGQSHLDGERGQSCSDQLRPLLPDRNVGLVAVRVKILVEHLLRRRMDVVL